MFTGFHNQSTLTMVEFSEQRETMNLQLIQRRSQRPKNKFFYRKTHRLFVMLIEMVQVSQENDKKSLFAGY